MEIVEKEIKISRILDRMNLIQKEVPILMEYETDARDRWPARWGKLREWLKSELSEWGD